jgi:large subunit ribosomal protein L29
MKVGELRVLEDDELGTRLKTSRRELYELRFKHAVGQLDNASQIARVRHDIARILTVLNERELGISTIQIAEPVGDQTAAPAVPKKAKPKRKEFVDEEDEEEAEATADETPEVVAEAEPEPEEKPKRGRSAKAAKSKAEKK